METTSVIRLREPYEKRPICFLGVAQLGGWRVKVYGISARSASPDPALVVAAKRLARERLPAPPVWTPPSAEARISQERYGVAILIVHEGRENNLVCIAIAFCLG